MAGMIGRPETWARRLSWATAIGLALGVIGPFGSYGNGGAVERIAYWTGLLWAGTLLLGVSVGAAVRFGSARGFPTPFTAGVATLAACAPLAAVVAGVGRGVWPRYTGSLSPLDWYAQTVFIAAPLVAAVLWLERIRAEPSGAPELAHSAEATIAPVVPIGAAASGLPPQLRADVLCLQMEDHYVRVHTAQSSELVLMGLRRAMTEVGVSRGEQVHRSWWVTRSAVQRVELEGRTATLVLENGLRVPVARNRVAILREAGWL